MKKNHCHSNEVERLGGKIQVLDGPERRGGLPPEKQLIMLPIKKTDNILDLGTGTGFLAIPAANMVKGAVYALDIDPSMLQIINAKAKEENVKNIQPIKGSIDHIPLSDDSIDIVLASLVLHEV